MLRMKDLQLIPVPFPLFQGLIVLGEASPPDPAVDDASRPVSAEVKLEPGADRLVSASSRSDWVQILHIHEFWVGKVCPFKLPRREMLEPGVWHGTGLLQKHLTGNFTWELLIWCSV